MANGSARGWETWHQMFPAQGANRAHHLPLTAHRSPLTAYQSEVLLQSPPQYPKRPAHLRFHCFHGDAQRFGNLGVRETVALAEDEDLAGAVRKLLDGRVECGPQVFGI